MNGIYRRIIVPTEKEHTVDLPQELYGLKVEVLAFPVDDAKDVRTTGKQSPESFYNTINLDFSDFKFNRDEANER